MICSGIDVSSGSPIEVAFQNTVLSVTPAAAPAGLYLAPGWIDIQVNGFAAVDYNQPGVSHEDIARSLRVLFSTGVPMCLSRQLAQALSSPSSNHL